MSTTKKSYSLWIEVKSKEINDVIARLAHKYETQTFLPHITLLSLFEVDDEKDLDRIVENLKDIAKDVEPFEIPLQKTITTGERFFQVSQTNYFSLAAHSNHTQPTLTYCSCCLSIILP